MVYASILMLMGLSSFIRWQPDSYSEASIILGILRKSASLNKDVRVNWIWVYIYKYESRVIRD